MKSLKVQYFLRIATHPWTIFPWGIIIASITGGKYEPWEIATANIPIILQGSTDWGGSCLFAGWVANYLFFSIAAPIYALVTIEDTLQNNLVTLLSLVLKTMKWHVLAFLIFGPLWWSYDAWILPNDHRNIFIFFGIYYSFLILYIAFLIYYKAPFKIFLSIIPSLVIILLMSDGITTKAGQWNQAGQDPEVIVRGYRHGFFLKWHSICDNVFGDIKKN